MDESFMQMALEEARAAATRGEVPVGAVLAAGENVIARAGNRILELHDPTAHAEILVLREAAAALGNERLLGTTLYVTLEPCTMCAGAISFARVKGLVFATDDPKGGAVLHGANFFDQPTCHWRPQVEHLGGALGDEASDMLKAFFKARR